MLLITVLAAFAAAQADDSVFFAEPYSNRLLRWNSAGISDALKPGVTLANPVFEDGSKIVLSAPPVSFNEAELVFATQSGRIGSLELKTGKLRTLYTADGECRIEAAYKGCIYSIALGGHERAYFLEHSESDEDTVMELSPGGVRPLISHLPGPSGPIWLRPNGELGALPYGQGFLSIPIPPALTPFAALSVRRSRLDSMGAFAAEGEGSLVLYDFSAVQKWNPAAPEKALQKLKDADAAAFDPCSGSIWLVSHDALGKEKIRSFHEGVDTAPAFPVNPAACPMITPWKITERKGAPQGDADFSVIQGYPSGTALVPSMETLSLGAGGSLTLESGLAIHATGAVDLRIFENAFEHDGGQIFSEPARVELQSDGSWVSTGCDCANPTIERCAGMQVTRSLPGSGIAPWDDQAGGFPVSLASWGLKSVSAIRITDCSKSSATPGGGGAGPHAGFDLDAVIVTPAALR